MKSSNKIKRLLLRKIRRDFQPPENLIESVVAEYEAQMNSGTKISPIRVYYDGENYWLADGFHRVAAAMSIGRKEMLAEIVPGTYADMEAEFHRMLSRIKDDLRHKQ